MRLEVFWCKALYKICIIIIIIMLESIAQLEKQTIANLQVGMIEQQVEVYKLKN